MKYSSRFEIKFVVIEEIFLREGRENEGGGGDASDVNRFNLGKFLWTPKLKDC